VKNNLKREGVGILVGFQCLFILHDDQRFRLMAALRHPARSRIVQKPQPTGDRAKKVANRPLLNPRMVFENGELWEFNWKRILRLAMRRAKTQMYGKTPEELAELVSTNNWMRPQKAPYATTDQWKTLEFFDNDFKIEIRMHEGSPSYGEFGWLGRVSLNANSIEAFPPEIRSLVSPPGQYSPYYQLYVDPLVGGPVPPAGNVGHFSLSPLITLINGREWFKQVFSIFGQ
jgi:hypothetical protein